MKKYIYSIFSLAMVIFAFSSCSYDDGVERGGDKNPHVTLYNYAVSLPLQSDNDTHVRVCCNDLVNEVYYMSMSEAEFEGLSESAAIDKVKNEGKKAELTADIQNGGSFAEFDVVGMVDACRIACVGVSGGNNILSSIKFFGLKFEDVCSGTYTFNGKLSTLTGSVTTTLQKCTNQKGIYRFKDLYGEGYHLKFYAAGRDTDKDGVEYTVVYTPENATPFTFSSYGAVSTRDVYTWQSNNADYLNGEFYDDGYVALWMQYYVSAGSLGYAWEEFVPED